MLFDFNLILWLGVLNLFLALFQLLSGLRIIKVKHRLHKKIGIFFFFTVFIHGIYALITNYI